MKVWVASTEYYGTLGVTESLETAQAIVLAHVVKRKLESGSWEVGRDKARLDCKYGSKNKLTAGYSVIYLLRRFTVQPKPEARKG